MTYTVEYEDGSVAQQPHLVDEIAAGRVTPLAEDPSFAPPPPTMVPDMKRTYLPNAPVVSAAVGAERIGVRIDVWWADDARYYGGTVAAYNAQTGTHIVAYDDGVTEELDLCREVVRWGPMVGSGVVGTGGAGGGGRGAAAGGATGGAGAGAPDPLSFTANLDRSSDLHHDHHHLAPSRLPSPNLQSAMQGRPPHFLGHLLPPHHHHHHHTQMMDHLLGAPPLGAPLPSLLESIPTVIPVICGSLLGELRTRDLTIALSTSSSSLAHGNVPYHHHHHHHGRRVSPTEFERLAGKESSKKWKATIRVLGTNGVPGETIGAWLAASGIDAETATGTGGVLGDSDQLVLGSQVFG